MINYDSKELQQAANRLHHNPDFQLIIGAMQEDLVNELFNTDMDDAATREACYQRWNVLTQIKNVTAALESTRQSSARRGND